MFNMKLGKLAAAILLVAGTPAGFAAETDFDAVMITAQKVAGNVTMLQGNGGNIGISMGDDGVLMIDDQFAPLSDKIKAAIMELGGSLPKFLLNTHWHGDHTGGNENFADSATIIAHDNVRLRLADPANQRVPKALPVITFADGIAVHFNGEEIRLVHLPHGHTDGDAAVWFTGSNVIHMGDEYVVGGFPFIDLNSGGSIEGLLENHERLAAILPNDIRIIPGHGPLSTKAEMAAWIAKVRTAAQIVIDQKTAGKVLVDVIAQGLPAEYDSMGTGFINGEAFIRAVYTSYGSTP